MNRFLIRILLISGIFFTSNLPVYSNQFVGGEISWTCLGSGKFVFKFIYYRDCNWYLGPSSVYLRTTVPGISIIPMNLIYQNDISPNGFNSNGSTQCLNCVAGNAGSPVYSLTEKLIYESPPLNLNGIPPANGWLFYIEDCCRQSGVTNVVQTGTAAFNRRIEARMFPYNGANTNTCFDSSPFFVEPPIFITCTGAETQLQHLAIDVDDDFMNYEFTESIRDSGIILAMSPGYSVNAPLPGTLQSINNITGDLNDKNGEMLFKIFTPGRFSLNIKVTSFRDNIKISEITRSYDLVIDANCPFLTGSDPNLPPQMDAPFIDSVSGNYSIYEDTVFAGEIVSFTTNILEFETFNNSLNQTVIFTAGGSQFGANFNDSTYGCLIPPCATLNVGIPDTIQLAAPFVFNWQTTTSHLNTFGWNPAKTYYFLFRASDNYCPVNGSKARIVSITVVDSTVGVESLNTQVQFKIYPNPANDGIYVIDFKNPESADFPFLVTTINGQPISSTHFRYSKGGSKGVLDLSSQPSGIYILRIGDSVSRIVKL